MAVASPRYFCRQCRLLSSGPGACGWQIHERVDLELDRGPGRVDETLLGLVDGHRDTRARAPLGVASVLGSAAGLALGMAPTPTLLLLLLGVAGPLAFGYEQLAGRRYTLRPKRVTAPLRSRRAVHGTITDGETCRAPVSGRRVAVWMINASLPERHADGDLEVLFRIGVTAGFILRTGDGTPVHVPAGDIALAGAFARGGGAGTVSGEAPRGVLARLKPTERLWELFRQCRFTEHVLEPGDEVVLDAVTCPTAPAAESGYRETRRQLEAEGPVWVAATGAR